MADGGVSRETQMSIEASTMFPGFRFSPTDVELISYYLRKKMEGSEKCVEVIPEVEICRHEPWDLPGKSVIRSENEWFFFSARGRKYPNGTQSKRATELGYWKATGKERNVKSGSDVIGTKRTLVFHIGRAPKGERTEWIMHEYCMYGKNQDSLVVCRLRRNADFRLNDNSNKKTRQVAASDGGIDISKAAAFSRIKCSSSYDSHSTDSTNESEHKLSNDTPVAESSCHYLQEDSDKEEEDDFYADILKDDIIKLDETPFAATAEFLPLIASMAEAQVHAQVRRLPPIPSQGITNRRIKLHKPEERGEEATKLPRVEDRAKCVVDSVWIRMGIRRRIMFVIVASLAVMVVLFAAVSGGFGYVKRSGFGLVKRKMNAKLYDSLWD
ncbi:NAC domain-containing protein 40-like [Mercurialis annua]|uniref:NAC domain-containing protein 40-like n=1 Tax=Mercurialis annua TaxID=3986 RepID=UPI00215DE3F4|nr:NAC domain-containing protein 40-like [Mercurialis annua]